MKTVYLVKETLIGRKPKSKRVALLETIYEDREDAQKRIHSIGDSIVADPELHSECEKQHFVMENMDLVCLNSNRSGRTVGSYCYEVIGYPLKQGKKKRNRP